MSVLASFTARQQLDPDALLQTNTSRVFVPVTNESEYSSRKTALFPALLCITLKYSCLFGNRAPTLTPEPNDPLWTNLSKMISLYVLKCKIINIQEKLRIRIEPFACVMIFVRPCEDLECLLCVHTQMCECGK